jgi:hypothetical protein
MDVDLVWKKITVNENRLLSWVGITVFATLFLDRNTGRRKTQRGKKNGHIGCDSMGGEGVVGRGT